MGFGLITRILSRLRSHLKRVGFVFLFLGGIAHAQPQAPIEWMPLRYLTEADSGHKTAWINAKGDTIVLFTVADEATPHDLVGIRVSGDNGATWSPHHVFERGLPSFPFLTPTVAFVSQGIVVCAQTHGNSSGLHLSTDLGLSWEEPLNSFPLLSIVDQMRDTIYCSSYDQVTWTGDLGATFAPLRPVEGWTGLQDGAVSNGTLHLVRATYSDNRSDHLVHIYGPRLDGEFTAPRDLNPDIFWTSRGIVDFTEDGIGMIAANVSLSEPILGPATVMRYVTRDDGRTWQEIDTLAVQTGVTFNSWVANSGHQWVYVWRDTVTDPQFDVDGMRFQFSANDGKSWYPSQQFAACDSGFSGGALSIDFSSNKINTCFTYRYWNGVFGYHYAEVEGVVEPDSMAPSIAMLTLPSDTVAVHDTLAFRVSAEDNDTLFAVQLRLMNAAHNDTLSIELDRRGDREYEAEWIVPEEGRFIYWFEAEDFWTHVTRLPNDSAFEFVTEDWSSLAKEPEVVQGWSVVIYPNPSNLWPTISLSQEWLTQGSTKLTIVNLMGQLVWQVDVAQNGQVPQRVGQTVLSSQITPPTGVYFLDALNARMREVKKFVILK